MEIHALVALLLLLLKYYTSNVRFSKTFIEAGDKCNDQYLHKILYK